MNTDISALAGSEGVSTDGRVYGISDADIVKWAKDADIVVLKAASCWTPGWDENCPAWWKDKIETKLKGIKVEMLPLVTAAL